MAGLYLHIPFCKQACHYCDFHFSTNPEGRTTLIQALMQELTAQQTYLGGEPLSTIYFGGGTPSLLSADDITRLLKQIHNLHIVSGSPEITLEANPDDLTAEKLASLKEGGINRLSIGIQSFNDDILKFMNRAHSSGDAVRCMEDARNAGFDNISIDMMYAIPGQSTEDWMRNLKIALSLDPEHLSAYSLTIEKKTAFGQWQAKGKLAAVDDAIAADEFEQLMDAMTFAGYDHYEISNFSKPGWAAVHNSNYWKQVHYLGIGPSAHSYDGDSRQHNVANNTAYTKSIESGTVSFEREILTRENKINEYLFTSLRTSWGCNLDFLKQNFDFDLLKEHESIIRSLLERKLIAINSPILTLTRAGKLLGDGISADLFIEGDAD